VLSDTLGGDGGLVNEKREAMLEQVVENLRRKPLGVLCGSTLWTPRSTRSIDASGRQHQELYFAEFPATAHAALARAARGNQLGVSRPPVGSVRSTAAAARISAARADGLSIEFRAIERSSSFPGKQRS
jgi:hypothetical protein